LAKQGINLMSIEITIPRLGWDMTEGVFAGWLKQDGDTVSPGDALFSLETDKATQDVEAMDEGTLRIAPGGPTPGDRLAVGTVIGRLAAVGEPAPVRQAPPGERVAAASISPAGPAVRRLARELVIDLRCVTGTGAAGRITPKDLQQHQRPTVAASPPATEAQPVPTRRRHPAISPRAKRLAVQRGIDWQELRGSGRTGRIRERDVREAAAPHSPSSMHATRVPISSIRRTIADRMMRSAQSTAPVTLTTTVDATELVRLRTQFKASVGNEAATVPSYTDFLAKLLAIALQRHPLLNSRWEGDHIQVEPGIHIGIAVDTEAGLLVPVVHEVASLSIRQLAARSRDLIDRARQRRLRPDEMQGGTFTVSNLGPFGIDAFTPIINHPECAILGVGRIQRQAVMVQDQVVGRDMLTLNLTFDHRIVDGAPAARFLQTLCQLIENPIPQLI
jgi:pyruvate dehydrogenase E2 component (dihydrolipoamide acetyltransferase)